MKSFFKFNKQTSYIIRCSILQFILVVPVLAQDIKYLDFLKSVNKDLLEQKAIDTQSLYGSEEDSIHYFLNNLSHSFELKPECKRKNIQAKEIKEKIIKIIEGKKVTYTFGKISLLLFDSNARLKLKLKSLVYFVSIVEGVFFIDLQQNDPSLMVVSDWNALNFQMIESENVSDLKNFSQDLIIEDYSLAICKRVLQEEQETQRLQQSLGQEVARQTQVAAPQQQDGMSASSRGQLPQLLTQLLPRAQQAALEQDQAQDKNSFLKKYRCFQQVEVVNQLNESQLELEEFALKYNFVPSELRRWKSRVESYHKEVKPLVCHTPQEKEKILEEYDQKSRETDFDFDKFYEDNGFKKDYFITLIRKTRGQNEAARAMGLSRDSHWSWNQRRDFVKEYKDNGTDSLLRRTEFCVKKNINYSRFSQWLDEKFCEDSGEKPTKRNRDEDERLDIKMAYEDAKKHGMPKNTFFNLIKVHFSTFLNWEHRKNLKLKQQRHS